MASRSEARPAALALLALAAVALGCGPEDQGPAEPGTEPRSGVLTVGALAPEEVLPGTNLRIAGTGFPTGSDITYRLRFSGRGQVEGGRAFDFSVDLPARYQSLTALAVEVSDALHQRLAGGEALAPSESAALTGTLDLTVTQDRRVFQRTAQARLTLRRQLAPVLMDLSARAVYLADRVTVSGAGFLLPGEGHSALVLEGSFARQLTAADKPDAQFTPFPLRELTLTPLSRTSAVLTIGASTLGITPGILTGKVTLVNRHRDGGVELRSEARDIQLALLRTQLGALSTQRISRGQRVIGTGAGFLPLDASADTATLVRLSGTFTAAIAGAPAAPVDTVLLTQILDSNHLQFVPRPQLDPEGNLVGLGGVPGRFVGSLTPLVTRGAEQQVGVPLPCGSNCVIEVVPPKQVLFAKYLANFAEGLRRFGLRNLEAEIRDRALAVMRRTYGGWNIEIRDTRPEDYDEYTTIEVGGPDPNGAGLFGLDNTDGHDRGNLRLNDYIGGFNATAEVEGNFAFGGVFIESFLSFAEAQKKKNQLATPQFNEIFAPFTPELGGRPADRAELQGGQRQAQLAEAVRVLGTLIGNTMAHEFGHSLGMAVGEGSHNPTDNDRELMDSGLNRTFAERAELGEFRDRPSGFSDRHRKYLSEILPRQ